MRTRLNAAMSKMLITATTAASALVLSALPLGESAAAQPGDSKMSAVYKLRFAGLKVGDFHLSSHVAGGGYALQGSAKLKFLSSLIFEITGGASSSGTVSKAGTTPSAFSFNFTTKKKQNGHMVMKFDNGAVSQVASQPPLRPHPEAIPVTASHVKGVFDPLTALFFSIQADASNGYKAACDRKIPVYDGLYRFDLQLSHKKTVRVVKKKGKPGYGGPAVICQVKYVPVAGHQPTSKASVFMEANNDIEVWLMPLPENRMFAPYHVSIPTPYGTAQATSTRFHVETASQKKFALVR